MSPRLPIDLLDALLAGPALVYDLAEATGQPPRSVEAHLRILSWQGRVVSAPGADGRTRWRLARGAP